MKDFSKIVRVVEAAASFGTLVTPGGAKLYGRCPHVAPQAWFHVLFEPLDGKGVRTIENDIGKPLPPVMKDFFRCNGLSLFSGAIALYGLRTSWKRTGDDVWFPFHIVGPNTVEKPRDAKPEHLFIGGYRQDGSHLVFDETTKCIHRRTRKSPTPLNEWPDFWTMLKTEVSRLSSMFDEIGKKKEPKRPTTPDWTRNRGEAPFHNLAE